jgi:biotin-dependent carboxylase-like uncharacterized protein
MSGDRAARAVLEVVEPGFLTTIQDAGRPDWTHLGVPVGGACDSWSLAVANLLVGNEPGAAALEMTIVGPVLAIRTATVIGLAGADLHAVVRETGERLEPGRSHRLAAGTTVAFPGAADAADAIGARGYVAIPGGVDVPTVLGSRSTFVAAGLGGIDGRPLAAGDILTGGPNPAGSGDERTWPRAPGDPFGDRDDEAGRGIGVLPGPAPGIERLVATSWVVGSGSDRTGVRLDGVPIAGAGSGGHVSHGVVRGAVQLPPDGSPIVLLADHQTTGGYPVIAVVMSADHPRLGQLRPGAAVAFRQVTQAEARAALHEQRAAFERAAATLSDAARWDELWRSAGG